MERPKRAYEMTISVGADTADDMASWLREMAYRVESGEIPRGVLGGSSIGGTYELVHRPEQTNERYFGELRDYLKSRRGRG